MKKVGIVIAALLCVALLCGGFFLLKDRSSERSEDDVQLTKVQKIITRDLENNYPATPREVVKFYNKIIECYYGEEYTDKEFDSLLDQAQAVFDQELVDNNPKADYKKAVETEKADYKERSFKIRQSSVCSSSEVQYVTDDKTGDKLAYVTASYFTEEKKKFDKTYQMYVLRKDKDGKWKILTYYKVDGKTLGEDKDDE